MKTISINSTTNTCLLNELQNYFGDHSELVGNCLKFQNDKGTGEIDHVLLDDGIGLYRFNMMLHQPMNLIFKSNETSSLSFCYCLDGSINQSFENDATSEKLEKFKTTIVGHHEKSSCAYEFKEGQLINLVMINFSLDASCQTETCIIKKQIHQLLRPHYENGFLFYRGSYNLKIADKIRQLEKIEETGVVHRLMTEGLVKLILALEVKQHGEDMAHATNDLGSLRVSEMETIKELSTFIDNHIDIKLSLDFLKSKTGLSPTKLQEGFKLMHGKTVNDYIKNIRLKVAEHLIKTTDLNISEVVYSIGLSSRSYFSRIFLEHYKMCPKDYKDQYGTVAQA